MQDAGLHSPLRFENCGYSDEIFAKNVAALRVVNPDLARTLENGGIHDGLFLALDESKSPRVCKRYRRSFARVEETPDELRKTAFEFVRSRTGAARLWIGLGTGERVLRDVESSPAGRVHFVHEADPGLLYLALARHDWRPAITAKKVLFFLGSDFTTIPLDDVGVVVRHPLLTAFTENAWNVATATGRIILGESPKRALVLEGELLEVEVARAFDALGFETWTLPIAALSKDEIVREVRGYSPEVTASVNFHPEFAPIAAAAGAPYLVWEIDPTASAIPRIAATDPAAGGTHIFTWKKSRVPLFLAAGWTEVEHLPLAADPAMRRTDETDPALRDAAIFVGSCMRANAKRLLDLFVRGVAQDGLRRNEWAGLLGDVRALEGAIEKSPCVRGIEDMLHDLLDRRRLPHEIGIDGATADVVVLLGESLAATKRCALARQLARDPLFRVYGEADWKNEIPARNYFGPLAHGRPLSRAYKSAAMTIDMNRVYQADIATLRLFEAVAAGGFVIAESSDDLPTVFEPGTEIAVYNTVAELEEEIRYFRAHPEKRAAIAERGRERLMREHTVLARVRTMLARIAVPA